MPLHPVVQKMLDGMKASGWQGIAKTTPVEARAIMAQRAALFGDGPEIGQIESWEFATRTGKLRGRLLFPKTKATALIVFYHGGGWVIGGIDESEMIARFLVDKTGAAVALVDYRLAPEHPFPTPIEDCYDGLLWGAKEAGVQRLNVPLVVAGDSAGGNLATVCAMLARDRGGPKIALQILMYPVCDCDMETDSYRAFGSGLVLTAADMGWFYDHYLQSDRHKRADPLVSPLRALALQGLPPALIITAEYDVLRDEAETYGKRLAAAGVKVSIKRYRGVTHGFVRMQNLLDVARTSMDDIAAVMAATIGRKQ
ncbi:MAG TPA: alpha/beta hydrolase [Stellaceae bacterium]|nr:alpha/beta hydrolase [Stellaceae bacterium]